jgi:hypothetical protein
MYLIVYYEVPAAEGQIEELKQKFENFVRTMLLYNKEIINSSNNRTLFTFFYLGSILCVMLKLNIYKKMMKLL